MGSITNEMLVAIIGLVISIVLVILIFMLMSRLKSMQSKYNKMMDQTGVDNLQDVIIDIQRKLHELQDNSKQSAHDIQQLRDRIRLIKGNMAIHRYNAFNDLGQGSDLSFSMAILDDNKNGMVLTAIHGREETYMYGKPIEGGESSYTLSPEEKRVVENAINNERLR